MGNDKSVARNENGQEVLAGMSSIVVVFPKKETAANIRNLLVRGGIDISGICTTGAQALQYADNFGEGIMICGYKMQDMLYSELRECLPESFEMLLMAFVDDCGSGFEAGPEVFAQFFRYRTDFAPLLV